MTTKLISINEYRKNLSKLWKKAQKEKIRYIVLVHSKPVFEVNPVSDSDDWDIQYTEENHKAYLKWLEELEKWETFSIEDLKSKYL